MSEKNYVSSLTAQNATETTKTLIATITIPQGVSRIVEIGTQIKTAGLTTLEDLSHILEVESDDMKPWDGTQKFVSDCITCVTSGAAVIPSKIHDCNIAVTPTSTINCYVTFNMALTINPSLRIFAKFV